MVNVGQVFASLSGDWRKGGASVFAARNEGLLEVGMEVEVLETALAF